MSKIVKYLAVIVLALPFAVSFAGTDEQLQAKEPIYKEYTPKKDSAATDTLYFPKPENGKQVVMVCYPENEYVTICYNVKLEDFMECVDDNKIKPYIPPLPKYYPKIDNYGRPIPED